MPEQVRLTLAGGRTVSALLDHAEHPFARLVLAHGAGAGMQHAFMADVATGLAERGVTTLRYQFPYMEVGSKRPDHPEIAHAAVRAAVLAAGSMQPILPLFAGGKSFGARMTSQAQAIEPLLAVEALIFLGFPLHPANKPSIARATHLTQIGIPMLFVQGTRDALAEMTLLEPLVAHLSPQARLETVAEGDHAFHLPSRTGRSDVQALAAVLDEATAFMLGCTSL